MPDQHVNRPDPEALLRQIEQQEWQKHRAKLKVFFGYASGVGKSYQMLDEARRRRERGEDVVLGAMQSKYAPEVQRLASEAEVIPQLEVNSTSALDLDAIVHRHPQVVVIDGLAHDNPSWARNPKRWMDINELLRKGISVITSVNLQYIEEMKDEVETVTGKRARDGIPRSFLDSADDIVVVDSSAAGGPHQLGAAPAGTKEQELQLSRLREMTLLVAAEVVERQLDSYLQAHGIEQTWGTHERILVCVTPKSNAVAMITSGRRSADRFHGELFVAYVRQPVLSRRDRDLLARNLSHARAMGAEVVVLESLDPLEAILAFARHKGVTQIFIGHSLHEGGWRRLWSSFVNRLIRSAEGIDVTIFPH
jgi:two-component system, OmpR family, sensor histidine kinase KdpD